MERAEDFAYWQGSIFGLYFEGLCRVGHLKKEQVHLNSFLMAAVRVTTTGTGIRFSSEEVCIFNGLRYNSLEVSELITSVPTLPV
jgi:hypothetical protein